MTAIQVDLDIAEHLRATRDHLTANGIPAALGRKPPDTGWTAAPGQSPFVAYVVLWRISALEAPPFGLRVRHTEARPAIQTSCWGANPDQANDLLDEVKTLMLNGSLAVPGRKIQRVIHEPGASDVRDPDSTPPLYYSADRYRIWSLPAPP
ncbi:hypothetical protein G1H11_14145 [Phytoactinopolyspora alkaliphila]|uniref:DUF3168 domain-containing protein n=1 Tax=Phytoactinopolyspora alkaliphila TaxID=1783498 RepID=A0A6N9YNC3_9ACTN|nr:hypothetical protein [Phytoactinopolyspora alkaliphila]NED96447.1 hypothetical protein [Phytoactinopolyspora alkaliphila]